MTGAAPQVIGRRAAARSARGGTTRSSSPARPSRTRSWSTAKRRPSSSAGGRRWLRFATAPASFDRFDAEQRVLELEIVIIGEHGLTLPPATYGWDEADRRHAVWRRKEALKALEAARKRALKLRRVRRILTLGLWWN